MVFPGLILTTPTYYNSLNRTRALSETQAVKHAVTCVDISGNRSYVLFTHEIHEIVNKPNCFF